MRKVKRAAWRATKRSIVNYVVDTLPAPQKVKRWLKSVLVSMSLNMLFFATVACILIYFIF